MEKLLKWLGYRECGECHRLFSKKYGGKEVFVFSIDHFYVRTPMIKTLYFCDDHAPKFDAALNFLSTHGGTSDNTVLLKLETVWSGNSYPKLYPIKREDLTNPKL